MEPLLIAIAFFTFFVGMWCAIMLLLSRLGGWHRLAQQFPAPAERRGTRFGMQSAKVGWVSYGNCVTIHAAPDGIFLEVWPLFRLGHAPLLLPWHAMHNIRVNQILWLSLVSVDIGEPRITTIQLSKKVFDAARAAYEAAAESGRGSEAV